MTSNKDGSKACHKSKIGGQALIEGIMMRGIDSASMAVRMPNGEIDIEKWPIKNGKNAPWYRKVPFVRGSVNMVTSLVEGYKCLSKSAEKSSLADDDEEMTPFEEKLTKLLGDKLFGVLMVIAVIFGLLIVVGLFVAFPTLIASWIGKIANIGPFKSLIEGLIKIVLFIAYLWLVGLMKDIARTYEYHGAEHKTIACYEAGEELNVENVRKNSRFHPRCGTSFILIVLVVGILVFSVVTWENFLIRMGLRIATLPIVIGIAYEIIRIAGKYDNIATRIISAPGMALQRLTTREPDDSQIEVAIAALTAVIPKDKSEDEWGE